MVLKGHGCSMPYILVHPGVSRRWNWSSFAHLTSTDHMDHKSRMHEPLVSTCMHATTHVQDALSFLLMQPAAQGSRRIRFRMVAGCRDFRRSSNWGRKPRLHNAGSCLCRPYALTPFVRAYWGRSMILTPSDCSWRKS